MPTKVVYVTGCLGFIGAYVTEACLDKGWYVIGVDKMTYASQPHKLTDFKLEGDHFKFINSDINDLPSLHDCDYIINTAAETHVDNSIVSSEEFLHSNVNGVHHLLELIRQKNRFTMPTLLHFSTDEVYGDISNGSHTEDDRLKPSNPYSATKAAADMLILAWARTFKIPYVIVRPTNNYGIGQYVEKLIPKTCKLIHLGKKVPLHNNGTPTRIWLHAKDTANAVIKIIEAGVQNEIYNISGNVEVSNLEIVKKIAQLMVGAYTAEPFCDFSCHREGQDVRYSLNDEKLRKLGWINHCDLDKELPSVVEYYQNNFIW
jgi:dTDP-glucose 4,6-dehydratase